MQFMGGTGRLSYWSANTLVRHLLPWLHGKAPKICYIL